MTTFKQLCDFNNFLNSKEMLINYWKEYPFGFALLINQIIDFRLIFNKINIGRVEDELLFPVMRVNNGDDILCIYKNQFYTINPFESNLINSNSFKDFTQIWKELIEPYIVVD